MGNSFRSISYFYFHEFNCKGSTTVVNMLKANPELCVRGETLIYLAFVWTDIVQTVANKIE